VYVIHRLGTNEVTLKTAAVSAFVQRRVFEDILKKVRKAIQFDDDDQDHRGASENVTHTSLVASHVSQDALDAVLEWMEKAEEALPAAVMLLSVCVHSMIASTPWQTRKSVQTTMYPCKPSRTSRTLSTCSAALW